MRDVLEDKVCMYSLGYYMMLLVCMNTIGTLFWWEMKNLGSSHEWVHIFGTFKYIEAIVMSSLYLYYFSLQLFCFILYIGVLI